MFTNPLKHDTIESFDFGDGMNQVTSHLENIAEICDKHTRGGNMWRFILDNGFTFNASALPNEYEHRTQKECFKNCTHLMIEDSSLIYCEGFAHNIIPVHHAWCVDQDGNVVDPTWKEPENCIYHGVPFKYDFVMEAADKAQSYGIFENFHLKWNMKDPKEKFLHEIWLEALAKSNVSKIKVYTS